MKCDIRITQKGHLQATSTFQHTFHKSLAVGIAMSICVTPTLSTTAASFGIDKDMTFVISIEEPDMTPPSGTGALCCLVICGVVAAAFQIRRERVYTEGSRKPAAVRIK